MNKKKHPKLSQICSYGFFSKGLKNEFETAVVNEPSVFEPLKFCCNCCNCPKNGAVLFHNAAMHAKDAGGKADSVDPDQTVPLGAV